jgi:hypothetical protein
MKYLLLVCWDAERMDSQTEPDPGDTASGDEEGFPWVDDLQSRGIWVTGDQLAPPRRARSVSSRAMARPRSPWAARPSRPPSC